MRLTPQPGPGGGGGAKGKKGGEGRAKERGHAWQQRGPTAPRVRTGLCVGSVSPPSTPPSGSLAPGRGHSSLTHTQTHTPTPPPPRLLRGDSGSPVGLPRVFVPCPQRELHGSFLLFFLGFFFVCFLFFFQFYFTNNIVRG